MIKIVDQIVEQDVKQKRYEFKPFNFQTDHRECHRICCKERDLAEFQRKNANIKTTISANNSIDRSQTASRNKADRLSKTDIMFPMSHHKYHLYQKFQS